MFITTTDDKIFKTMQNILIHGVLDAEEESYRTRDKKLVLLVSNIYKYVELYSHGRLIFRMKFLEDSTTWGGAELNSKIEHKGAREHYYRMADLYEKVKEEKNVRVLKKAI